ncbi:MAG: GNAT family N-acetyltransferase [Spirochaetales bacterium]|nr:GNAT family N-acetyltransferase [Spirochaetales bacterium]
MDEIKIKQCQISDLNKLIDIGVKTYFDTFKELCSEEVMAAYLQEAFDKDKILSEINNKNSFFYFVYVGEHLAGYIKINIDDAQCDLKEQNGLEIERIYVKNSFKRKGIGNALIRKGVEMAKDYKKDFIWLGVWEKNESAIEFYNKNNFFEIGTHSFRMGDEIQNDYIMKKEI